MRRLFRKNYIIFIITAVLLLSVIPLSSLKISSSKNAMKATAIAEFTSNFGTVTDKFQTPVYSKGKLENSAIFERIIGSYDSNDNTYSVQNSIIYQYEDELINTKYKKGEELRETDKVAGVINTTLLPASAQQKIVDIFGKNKGSVTAYNYKTGEILALLTVGDDSNKFSSENLSLVTPGSTMKMITSICAAKQGIDLSKLTFTCNGSYTLKDGNVIKCHGTHGSLNYENAFRWSCNAWFAQCIELFDIDETIKILSDLGFNVNKTGDESRTVDRLSVKNSKVSFKTKTAFADVWGLIGQVNSDVNPLQMVQIFGAVANEGKSANPYLISKILNKKNNDKIEYEAKTKTTEYLSKKEANALKEVWETATKNNDSYTVNSRVKMFKTGTAQKTAETETGTKTQINRLLVCATDDGIAFFVNVENTNSSDDRCFTIVNTLLDYID